VKLSIEQLHIGGHLEADTDTNPSATVIHNAIIIVQKIHILGVVKAYSAVMPNRNTAKIIAGQIYKKISYC